MECMRTGDVKRIAAKLDDPAGSSVHQWRSMIGTTTVVRSPVAAACKASDKRRDVLATDAVPRLGGVLVEV